VLSSQYTWAGANMGAPQRPAKASRLRFGVFEADLSTHELFKHGGRIRIQDQPFEILRMLLERAGEPVTREELRKRLWPDHTFVEYEDSLNTAMRKLRAALSDSSAQPHYIETLVRHGYRFIAPVSPIIPETTPSPTVLTAPVEKEWPHLWDRRIWWGLATVAALATALVLMRSAPVPRLVRITKLTNSGRVTANQKLLTDGPRLYFTGRPNGPSAVEWMPASGGEAVPIALPFSADLQDISPDGSEMLVRNLNGPPLWHPWIVSTSGAAPRPLDVGGVNAAIYTPDGRGVVYSRGSTVYACDRGGGNRRRVVSLPGEVFGIMVSPNDDRLRFYVGQTDAEGVVLWESRTDGTGVHRVIEDSVQPRFEWGGGWTSDGRWFTFTAAQSASGDVWVLGEPRLFRRRPLPVRLTSGPVDFIRPTFSRDGKRIFVTGVTRRGELVRYDFKKREFSQYLGGISVENVEFSPDRKWVIYVSYPEGRLWRARADGSEPSPLTGSPMRAGSAAWLPDGSRIAFEGRPARGGPWNVYVLSSAGGAPEMVAANTDRGGFTWRRDGKALIVGNGSEEPSPLQVVDLERHTVTPLAGTERAEEPSLSPSGRYLLAKLKVLNTLVLFDLTRHTKKELATRADEIPHPSWSQHERYIIFSRIGPDYYYYRVRISDGMLSELMELKEFDCAGSKGAWSTIAPDGSLLLLRDLGGADLYAIDWSER
jgi:DNA-binding winged helix-turn-helix (wHTH) protein/Tol biopolymer transport system component